MHDCLTLAKLYYLMTFVDGTTNNKEEELGKKLIRIEKLDEKKFADDLQMLTNYSQEDIYRAVLSELKKKSLPAQINCLAWSGLIANSDGFMDKKEWQLIYQLYHKELKIDLQELIKRQRELVDEIIKLSKSVNN